MKGNRKFELLSSGHDLLEAPLWSGTHGLLFADMTAGGARAFRSDEPLRDIWPYRKGIGGMCLHDSGALIVTGKNIALRPLNDTGPSEAATVLLEGSNPRERFNDLAVDNLGRIYAGTYDAELASPGVIYLIDVDGSSRVVASGTTLSNGIAVSPDNSRLYQADTLQSIVIAYDIGRDGILSKGRPFVSMPGEKPDGMLTDTDGNLFVAAWGSGRISVFSPEGSEIDRIIVPDMNVTSLTFGGDNFSDLYVVSGSPNIAGAGCLYRCINVGAGRETAYCKLR